MLIFSEQTYSGFAICKQLAEIAVQYHDQSTNLCRMSLLVDCAHKAIILSNNPHYSVAYSLLMRWWFGDFIKTWSFHDFLPSAWIQSLNDSRNRNHLSPPKGSNPLSVKSINVQSEARFFSPMNMSYSVNNTYSARGSSKQVGSVLYLVPDVMLRNSTWGYLWNLKYDMFFHPLSSRVISYRSWNNSCDWHCVRQGQEISSINWWFTSSGHWWQMFCLFTEHFLFNIFFCTFLASN